MNWKFINLLNDIYKLLDELPIQEKERDYPLVWEKVHATSCAQIGRLLAKRRGVDAEVAALACALHDIGRWYSGQQTGHARQGEEPARRFMERLGLAADVKEGIVQAVIHHSEKEKVGTALEEIVKDADILDCYLYGDEIERPFHLARLHRLLQDTDY